MKKGNLVYLRHILDAISRIEEYTIYILPLVPSVNGLL